MNEYVLKEIALKRVRTCLEETSDLINTLNFASQSEENYQKMSCTILHEEIRIPKMHRVCIMKIFRSIKLRKPKLVVEEFFNFLIVFLNVNGRTEQVFLIPYDTTNYITLASFLKNSGNILRNLNQHLLFSKCIYGYFLEVFYQTHLEKLLRSNISQNFQKL